MSCFFLFIIPTFTFSQTKMDSSSFNILKEIVTVLSHDSLNGRAVGSIEEKKSLDYIQTKFNLLTTKKLNIQPFTFQLDTNKIKSQNAFYFQNNKKKGTILIGAHYDHIGFGGKLSKSATSNEIHNGADDNASGVALLLSLSKQLVAQKNPKYNYLFVFYSAHEEGLYGSKEFLDYYQKKIGILKPLKMVVNLDMVGRMDPDLKKIKCYSSNDSLIKIQPSFLSENGFQLNLTTDLNKLNQLDTREFLKLGIPCLNFTTGIHIDYHSTSDDEKYINYNGIILLEKFILKYILSLN